MEPERQWRSSSSIPYESAPPRGEIGNDAVVAAARVSMRERKWVRGKEMSSLPRGKPLFLHLSMDEEGPFHDRRCPVPADKDEAATHHDAVLSTVE
jgi:hypothetical protein